MMTTVGLALTGASIAGCRLCHSIPAAHLLLDRRRCSAAGIAVPAFTSLFSKVLQPTGAGGGHVAQPGDDPPGPRVRRIVLGPGIRDHRRRPPFFFAGLALLAALGVFLASARVLLPQP